MRFRVGKRHGDTLVEVTIAIGIFSLVAVSVVSVVSASTSSSQSALETTVAREEIDAQAEALRFIQNSYLSDLEKNGTPSDIWTTITKKAVNPTSDVLQYNVTECSQIYNDQTLKNAFVIDTRQLRSNDKNKIVVGYDKNKNKFSIAEAYPRLTYAGDFTLENLNEGDTLQKAEGIFIIAVKNAASGDSATNIVEGETVVLRSAYYDFYIRTCWYAPNSNTPTTISSVVRLYNPDVATENVKPIQSKFREIVHQAGIDEELQIPSGMSRNLWPASRLTNAPSGKMFDYWCKSTVAGVDQTAGGTRCPSGIKFADKAPYQAQSALITNIHSYVYPVWKNKPTVSITFCPNYSGLICSGSQTIFSGEITALRPVMFTRANYTFIGWNTSSNGSGTAYADKGNIYAISNVVLYAQWKANPKDTITYNCGSGTVKGGVSTSQTFYANGTLKSIQSICNAPAGYIPNYWSSSAGNYGNGGAYTFAGNRNITLRAEYQLDCPVPNGTAYTFNKKDGSDKIQTWSVPCAGTYEIEAWGAQGGNVRIDGKINDYTRPDTTWDIGGYGGHTKATISFSDKGRELYIGVGEQPATPYNNFDNNIIGGGWNGGGGVRNGYSAAGGGATHIAIGTNRGTLNHYGGTYQNEVLLVAAGGGGGSMCMLWWIGEGNSLNGANLPNRGGAGGGTSGAYGFDNGTGYCTHLIGGGGTQNAGGASSCEIDGGVGGFGQGGFCNVKHAGGGGGGGLFGGGAGWNYNGSTPGGGGSSYVNSRYMTNGILERGGNTGHGRVVIRKIR